MEDYEASTYGDRWAAFYDDESLQWPDSGAEVQFLADRARLGPALDLGAGTGRTAVPLGERGIRVVATDASEKMLDILRGKQPKNVECLLCDFTDLSLAERFSLVYCVGQSFLQLQTQDKQLLALEVARKHLTPDGSVIVEGLYPDLRRFRVGQDFLTNRIFADRVLFTASTHHPSEQQIRSMTFVVRDGSFSAYPNFIRYVWPSELRLLAERAGLRFLGFYRSWHGSPYRGGPGAFAAEFGIRQEPTNQ